MSISCFFANTKNFSYPYIFEYMMTANQTLFEKEGVFGFHVSTCHLEQLVAVAEDMFTLYSTDRSIAVHVHVAYVPRSIHVGRGFIITSLFGAYPLLGAYLLTTYTYKRIRLLTGVYSIWISAPPPPPPTSTSCPLTWWMLPGLPRFSPAFRSRVLVWTQTEGINGGGLGTMLDDQWVSLITGLKWAGLDWSGLDSRKSQK